MWELGARRCAFATRRPATRGAEARGRGALTPPNALALVRTVLRTEPAKWAPHFCRVSGEHYCGKNWKSLPVLWTSRYQEPCFKKLKFSPALPLQSWARKGRSMRESIFSGCPDLEFSPSTMEEKRGSDRPSVRRGRTRFCKILMRKMEWTAQSQFKQSSEKRRQRRKRKSEPQRAASARQRRRQQKRTPSAVVVTSRWDSHGKPKNWEQLCTRRISRNLLLGIIASPKSARHVRSWRPQDARQSDGWPRLRALRSDVRLGRATLGALSTGSSTPI